METPVNSNRCVQAGHTAGALLRGNALPRLEASVLLAHVLGTRRESVLAYPEREVPGAIVERYEELVERRQRGIPIAYLTGSREFYGIELQVSPDVLIPRPETELLVEAALERLRPESPARVLDLGTGSGAIAIAIARHRPRAIIEAVDASVAAVAVAAANARGATAVNVGVHRSDWYTGIGAALYDLIVSNPPYVRAGDPHLEEGDVRHEPLLALVSGAEGLDAIRVIVAGAPACLVAGGWLLFEHGYDQAERCRMLMRAAGFDVVASLRDLAGIERVCVGRKTG